MGHLKSKLIAFSTAWIRTKLLDENMNPISSPIGAKWPFNKQKHPPRVENQFPGWSYTRPPVVKERTAVKPHESASEKKEHPQRLRSP
jgi:hypothetical protein